MPQLEHRKPQGFDFLENAVAGMTAEVTRKLAPQLDRLNQSTDMLLPMVSNAISQTMRQLGPALQEIITRQNENKAQLMVLLDAQNALVRALGQIEIPDYTNTLARIEENRTDLTPIQNQLQALTLQINSMEEDDDPRQWRFEINRDVDGNIDSVDAVAVEDEE